MRSTDLHFTNLLIYFVGSAKMSNWKKMQVGKWRIKLQGRKMLDIRRFLTASIDLSDWLTDWLTDLTDYVFIHLIN